MKRDAELGLAARSMGAELSEHAIERLLMFEDLLVERAVPLGFVSESRPGAIRSRHILDCLRAAPILPAGRILDLGSGAGLPGIVVAAARPDVTVDLLESQRRRISFLELAVERLALDNAVPLLDRAQRLRGVWDAALARAFASARTSWAVAQGLLRSGGCLVYFAGASFRVDELGDADVLIQLLPAPPPLASAGPLVIMTQR